MLKRHLVDSKKVNSQQAKSVRQQFKTLKKKQNGKHKMGT